ncbi:restriction endonuclease subunit S [Paenibacillus tarimensis]
MNREESYLQMLDAAVRIQFHVSAILEAKALEAEKSRNWVCNYVCDSAFEEYEDQLKQTLQLHETVVEVIDGLTKMEIGLGKNLKAVLNKSEQSSGAGMSEMFGDMDG